MTEAGRRLQAVFAAIHRERMRDLPVVNPALEVATVGFDEADPACLGGRLGVLVTPWCMNLVLLAPDDEGSREASVPRPGDKQSHELPSGTYEFVVADEPGVGRFQTCSLFSPMFEFGDQATAIATARAALLAIMDEAYTEGVSSGEPLGDRPGATGTAPNPISRRDLLRGEVFR